MDLVSHHWNKVNITMERFPSAYKSYVYTILYSIKRAEVLCLKQMNMH